MTWGAPPRAPSVFVWFAARSEEVGMVAAVKPPTRTTSWPRGIRHTPLRTSDSALLMGEPSAAAGEIAGDILTSINVLRYTLRMGTMTRSRMKSTSETQAGGCCEPALAEGEAAPLATEPSATLAERLKALADPTRLRMLDLLAAQRE